MLLLPFQLLLPILTALPASKMLSFASIWALEELALQELQNEIRFHSLFSITANRKLTSFSGVDKAAVIQYEPVGHVRFLSVDVLISCLL